ncbi:MAG: PTS glucose transporter subunit IIA [Eubacteriales bacterium]|nr:PTS glucose transporter subunit IIA [Eubacteriales bacterium]
MKGLFGGASGVAVAAPVSGTVVPLADVSDPTFAQGILGQGAAVLPSEGRIVAPADGTVDVMFDTGHAVSMTTADGAELLIHVGIDTVQLNGQHYKACCKAGEKVTKGQTLIEFDPEAIKAAGYDTVTPVIVCNSDAYAAVKLEASGAVAAGDALLSLQQK